ncbi:hypothetical protein BDZ45DRAFT_258249 [Acephala macrosclerotiorum]|nr:hypothetical protein BDZ45DRAFT_258249 [Acephala macrosclerotiorum]
MCTEICIHRTRFVATGWERKTRYLNLRGNWWRDFQPQKRRFNIRKENSLLDRMTFEAMFNEGDCLPQTNIFMYLVNRSFMISESKQAARPVSKLDEIFLVGLTFSVPLLIFLARAKNKVHVKR